MMPPSFAIPQYRERIAESLYRGVAKYVNGLSGLRVAQNSSRIPGNSALLPRSNNGFDGSIKRVK